MSDSDDGKRPPGRPASVMTPDAIEGILRAVRVGITPETAALTQGVNSGTMRSYRRHHPEFDTAIEKAQAEAKGTIHTKMLAHMEKQWTACAWMLERRWPEEYGRRDPQLTESVNELGAKLRQFMAQAHEQDTAEGEEPADAPD